MIGGGDISPLKNYHWLVNFRYKTPIHKALEYDLSFYQNSYSELENT